MKTKKKVAVTGGSGQLGTLVLRRLLNDRSIGEILSLDLRPPAVVSARLKSVTADVRDPDFAKHLAGCDALVHLAFVVTELRPRDEVQAINVEGSKNVFRAAVAAGVKQIVYSSSLAAYGVVAGHPVPIVESTPRRYQPSFPYSATKFEVEAFLDEFEREHPGLVVTRLRPAILVGRSMEHALGDALRRRVLIDLGDTPMPVVWDEDVAEAVLLAIKKSAGGAFNLAAEDQVSTAQLARASGMRLVKVPAPVARGLLKLSPMLSRLGLGRAMDPSWLEATVPMIMSSARAHAELGWSPRCPTSRNVIAHYANTVPRRIDRRIALFMRVLALAGRRELPEEAQRAGASGRIHFAISGPGGGDYTLRFEGKGFKVEPGIPRPPTATISLSEGTLLDLLSGRIDFSSARLTGRVRVEGEGFANLILEGIVTTFRASGKLPGFPGFASRRMQQWFAKGATS